MLVYPTLNNQGGTKLSTISHNIHMGHYGPNSKLGQVWHTPPSKNPMSSSGPTYPQSGNDNQERSLLAHATVHPVPAHVPRRALRRAYTRNEPHVQPLAHTCPWLRRSALIPFCNAPESKRLWSTLHAEWTTPTTIPLTLSSSLHVKGLTWGWWDGL
jgi:hypothetical protein